MTKENLTLFFVWCWLRVLHNEATRKACKRRYAEKHHAEVLARSAKWQRDNRDRRNKVLREWTADRQATDERWKFRKNLTTRIWWALRAKTCRSANVLKLLGCTVEELKAHLQHQFLPGMSWDNYGQWHIDHIRPCASFDLTDPEQQRQCFNFKNLQPLWAKDNLSKGAKFCAA